MSDLIQPSRRGFLATALFIAAAPAIVRASSLMPVRSFEENLFPNAGPVIVGSEAELTDVIRRAFVPNLFVQIYDKHPILGLLEQMQ